MPLVRKKGEMPPRRPKISAAAKLLTLNLYDELQDSNRVGEAFGISGNAVRNRLRAMKVVIKTPHSTLTVAQVNGSRLDELREELQAQIIVEQQQGLNLGLYENDHFVRPGELLDTINWYFELKSLKKTGDKLGITESAVATRLKRLGVTVRLQGRQHGLTPAQMNNPDFIRILRRRLSDESAQEKEVSDIEAENAEDQR